MPYIPNEQRYLETKAYGNLGENWVVRIKIEKPNREYLDNTINELVDKISEVHKSYNYDMAFAGLFNYCITRMFTKFLNDNFDRLRYWHSPAIRGILQDVGDEFYRRIMIPYEDVQIEKNGDIPDYLELKKTIK